MNCEDSLLSIGGERNSGDRIMHDGDAERGPSTRSRAEARRAVPQTAQSRRHSSPPARTLSPPNQSPMTSPRRPSSSYAWPPTPPSETQSTQTQPTIKARLRSQAQACYFAPSAMQAGGTQPHSIAAASKSTQCGVSSAGVARCAVSNDGKRQHLAPGAVSSEHALRSWATDPT
jgi:hypothetical protein